MLTYDQGAVQEGPAPDTIASRPEAVYQERCRRFGLERDHYARLSQQTGIRNVMLFFGAVFCLFVAAFGGVWIFFFAAVALFATFVVSFIRLGKTNLAVRRYAEYVKINTEGLGRLSRDWGALPLRQPKEELSQAQPYVTDLDLLGRASLQHLLSTPTTGAGLSTLRSWLVEPSAAEEVRARQSVVSELAPMIDFRDDFELSGRLMGDASESVYEVFLRWVESEPWLQRRPALIWESRILPVLTLVLLALQLFTHLVPYPFWLVPLGINILLSQQQGKVVEELLDQVSDRQRVFQPYSDLFSLVSRQSFTSPRLQELVGQLSAGGRRADEQMARLARILQFGDLRRSLIFPVLQAVLLWNFHTLWLLEGWQRDNARHAREWLYALGTLEAYTALSTLSYDHPDWAFPEVTESRPEDAEAASGRHGLVLEARNLGHPLLPDEVCVGNDVSIGPGGTFLLVTGSNMSGKSTLLRAIGTNIVLAQAGGPVCASWLRLAPVTLTTSIRVQDSLEHGVSYYMAELQRLKQVVDTSLEARAGGAESTTTTPLFLLDEILHGTNTSERQIAARHIIAYLLSIGATGAVSTHDLTLADSPQFAEVSTQVHFTEHFERDESGRPSMSFDYTLRPGPATSTNALKLMEIVGLPLPEQMPPPTPGTPESALGGRNRRHTPKI